MRTLLKTTKRNSKRMHQKGINQVQAGVFFFLCFADVHLSKTLANDQLDTQLLYFIIRLLQSSTCFELRRAHHQEVKLY